MTPLHGAGPQTAGMLRICKGQEERHVWPVHLSGWLAIGWRVVGAKQPTALEGLGAMEEGSGSTAAALAQELEHEAAGDAKPVSTRGKRGRRSREELTPEAAADAAPLPEPIAPAEQDAPLTALPEGLLDDPLI
jgi:hypothetical protein